MTTKKRGAGSHNRDTSAAIEHQESSRNLRKDCRCLLHRKPDGSATSIEQTMFNRQGEGTQSMCSEGKTLIDAIKHKFWRAISLILLSAKEHGGLDTPALRRLRDIEQLRDRCGGILNEIFDSEEMCRFDAAASDRRITRDCYARASTFLESNLQLKALGFYGWGFSDVDEARQFYAGLRDALDELTSVAQMNALRPTLDQVLSEFEEPAYVKESARSRIFYPVEQMTINWSKMNDVYGQGPDGSFYKTTWRGPFHNTRQKAHGDAGRIVRYLVEIDRSDGLREVNSWINTERVQGLHADRVFPLALGGKHSRANIAFIDADINIAKRDRLTFGAYSAAIRDLEALTRMVNNEACATVLRYFSLIGKSEERFEQHRAAFTKDLRKKMEQRQQNFLHATLSERTHFLKQARPDLSPRGVQGFIDRFERKSE